MQDTFKHQGMRKQLINELRKDERIKHESIFNAFDEVPRHYFLDLAFEQQAYSNMAFQIGAGQTISHPITVAFQTELLDIQRGDKVLEIGTGSGFQTCILYSVGANVFSIERQPELHRKSKPIIEKIVTDLKEKRLMQFKKDKQIVNDNKNLSKGQQQLLISEIEKEFRQKTSMPRTYLGDGYLGSPLNAPFDKIIVTCGAPGIPPALVEQLKPGGIMVIPIGEGKEQIMKRIIKGMNGELDIQEFGTFKFVPMLENIEKKRD